ncbi:MAG TPA: hypothetical protein VMS99_08665 [Acidimicrobiia bacterium]|nr:hypothetical protein [Acidimicrobiia bacterium]
MRWRLWLIVGVLAVIAACDGDGGGGVSSPCDLADAELVESVFGGTVAPGVEGAALNCDFAVEGGPVFSVAVFHYGSDDGWESTRQGFVDNRSGVTDVEGIGDDAFFPGDFGARELVVRAGGEIFSVTAFIGFDEPTAEVINAVADLSKAIADELSS